VVTLDEVTSGQQIVLLARPLDNGTFEVVSLAIGASKAQIEAAGNARSNERNRARPAFGAFPNPANKFGPTISPNN
jgi:hypothetical protein